MAALTRVPWFFALKLMVTDARTNGWYRKDIHSIRKAFLWWITPERLAFYFVFRTVRRCVVSPVSVWPVPL